MHAARVRARATCARAARPMPARWVLRLVEERQQRGGACRCRRARRLRSGRRRTWRRRRRLPTSTVAARGSPASAGAARVTSRREVAGGDRHEVLDHLCFLHTRASPALVSRGKRAGRLGHRAPERANSRGFGSRAHAPIVAAPSLCPRRRALPPYGEELWARCPRSSRVVHGQPRAREEAFRRRVGARGCALRHRPSSAIGAHQARARWSCCWRDLSIFCLIDRGTVDKGQLICRGMRK